MPQLQQMPGFIDAVTAEYISRKGGPLALVNALLRNSYEFGELLASDSLKLSGGESLKFDTLIRAGQSAGFVAPMSVRTPTMTQHVKRGTLPWTFFEYGVSIEETEKILSSGRNQVFDLWETRFEAEKTSAHNRLEEIWWDGLGNFDKQTNENRPFLGLKAWVTRTGYAVDGSATLAELSVATDRRWLNRYVGPLGSNLNHTFTHETAKTITNAAELRKWMRKANRYSKFASPNGLKFAQDDKADAEKGAVLRAQKIYADEIAYDALEQTADVLGHGNESLASKELARPDPVFKGVPVTHIEDLGIGSAGIPSGAAAATANGTVVAGSYANTGELFMVNTRNLKVFGQDTCMPLIKPTEWLPQQQCLWKLFRYFFGTVCDDRSRQVCLWGFSPLASV